MKYELGEYTEGKAKGFRYWYPVLEEAKFTVPDGDIKGDLYFNIPMVEDDFKVREQKLLYFFNIALKQRVAEQVKQKNIHFFAAGVSAELAQLFPDGILNKQETCLTDLLK